MAKTGDYTQNLTNPIGAGHPEVITLQKSIVGSCRVASHSHWTYSRDIGNLDLDDRTFRVPRLPGIEAKQYSAPATIPGTTLPIFPKKHLRQATQGKGTD